MPRITSKTKPVKPGSTETPSRSSTTFSNLTLVSFTYPLNLGEISISNSPFMRSVNLIETLLSDVSPDNIESH